MHGPPLRRALLFPDGENPIQVAARRGIGHRVTFGAGWGRPSPCKIPRTNRQSRRKFRTKFPAAEMRHQPNRRGKQISPAPQRRRSGNSAPADPAASRRIGFYGKPPRNPRREIPQSPQPAPARARARISAGQYFRPAGQRTVIFPAGCPIGGPAGPHVRPRPARCCPSWPGRRSLPELPEAHPLEFAGRPVDCDVPGLCPGPARPGQAGASARSSWRSIRSRRPSIRSRRSATLP